MGGREASRGFLYQGFAAVLEALTDVRDWNKIYVELPTAEDKVDISLELEHKIVKCIQVKSTINSFTKSDIILWLEELIRDKDSPEYELFLIGQCDTNANIFIKSINKYYNGVVDKEARLSLDGFDTDSLDNKKIQFSVFPFDLKKLEGIVRDSLHQYISYKNQMLGYDQLKLIASATVTDQMISSTHGQGIDRKDFDGEMEKRILLVANQYNPKRISIGIRSITGEAERSEVKIENCLSFIDKFAERKIKSEYDWNKDIYRNLKDFLLVNTSTKYAYQIFWDAHSSIAFAAGRILNSKTGINVFPMQRTTTNGTVLWDVKQLPDREYSNWVTSNRRVNREQYDSALVINITRNIYNDVVKFIKESNLLIGRIFNCTLDGLGATNFSIEDGTHASILANGVYDIIGKRSIEERRGTLHIFAAAPNAFMFFLGQNSAGFGKCILYEYDFEHRNNCTYSKSISFINE